MKIIIIMTMLSMIKKVIWSLSHDFSICKSLSSYHTSHPSYSTCVYMFDHRIVYDCWYINHKVEYTIIITIMIILIIYLWAPSLSSFLMYNFYLFISSLHYYYRMDGPLLCGPVWMVNWRSCVLYWRTVLMRTQRLM